MILIMLNTELSDLLRRLCVFLNIKLCIRVGFPASAGAYFPAFALLRYILLLPKFIDRYIIAMLLFRQFMI